MEIYETKLGRFLGRLILLIFLLGLLYGCSPSLFSGEWHLMKAKKKRPDLFEVSVDTIYKEVKPKTLPLIDCDSLLAAAEVKPVEWTFLTDMVSDGETKQKEGKIIWRTKYVTPPLTKEDSSKIAKVLEAEIDCPDCEDIIKEVKVPVPVEMSFIEKISTWAHLILVGLIIGFGVGFSVFGRK